MTNERAEALADHVTQLRDRLAALEREHEQLRGALREARDWIAGDQESIDLDRISSLLGED